MVVTGSMLLGRKISTSQNGARGVEKETKNADEGMMEEKRDKSERKEHPDDEDSDETETDEEDAERYYYDDDDNKAVSAAMVSSKNVPKSVKAIALKGDYGKWEREAKETCAANGILDILEGTEKFLKKGTKQERSS